MTTAIKQEPQQQNRFIIFDVQEIFIGKIAKVVCFSTSYFEIRTFRISTSKKYSGLTNKEEKVTLHYKML